ncbi:hypothetical protein [Streptomyces odonnellii]|uniref:hypothetical protein n=1 Tax=Streptomyces odonnellii TaxID=1417980 RepID=UPI000B029788|nr:hypothetical protein [Streptomyces odonnellii]
MKRIGVCALSLAASVALTGATAGQASAGTGDDPSTVAVVVNHGDGNLFNQGDGNSNNTQVGDGNTAGGHTVTPTPGPMPTVTTFYSPLVSVQPGQTRMVTATCGLNMEAISGAYQQTGLQVLQTSQTANSFTVEVENTSTLVGAAVASVNCVSL